MNFQVFFKQTDCDWIPEEWSQDDRQEMTLYFNFFTEFIRCPSELYIYDNGAFSILQLYQIRKVVHDYYWADFLHFTADNKLLKIVIPSLQ